MAWFKARPRALPASFEELHTAVTALRLKVKALEERADAADLAHERLRGRFYGLGLHKVDQPSQTLSKSELLAKFVPRR